MKNVKLLFILTFVAPVFAKDLQQSRQAAMDKADKAFFAAIENCHRNDGKHADRMYELKNTTYNLSAHETHFILQQRLDQAINKSNDFRECNDCKDVANFADEVLSATYVDITLGRGNRTISELRELHVNK
jgi:hypothetical protein